VFGTDGYACHSREVIAHIRSEFLLLSLLIGPACYLLEYSFKVSSSLVCVFIIIISRDFLFEYC
jgi:hypothetical protein